ncbi:hypothetical protein Smp_169660 [Schistosoma mansoni]|uniref:hypothetical protein n=1 Tax=Schistosoma mansoni TaxID=6183 RepID=UPI00019B34A4|nr:hypothetical protein Smp_169660 [Schistosoma mansoni]|eukprot:XP_018652165.1 hypothetical protein Smp_169660 [Schistosoma mansoni]
MESREMNAAYDNLLADIHKRLLLIQQHTYNIDNFKKYRRKIADLLFAENKEKSVSKLLSDDFGKLSLRELRNINEILKIWSNISKQLKRIQLNLSTQLDSAKTDIHREILLSDSSSDLLGEQFKSSKTNPSTVFDLSFFDSFFFCDQSYEYTVDTRHHSCSPLESHKPKSALKKPSDISTIPEKVNISREAEIILWEPVYTINKSLMKCLIHATLQTLQDYASQLQFGCNPTAIDIMMSSKTDSSQCGNNLNIEYYNCLNILLQTPVFATSVHGQLFNPSDLCFSDFWYHKNQNILDEQFNPGLTTQNMLCSWNGAVGTGAGLPMPRIYISKSLEAFIAFNLEILLPMILNLLQTEINEQQSKSQSDNRENSNNNFEKSDDDLNNRQTSLFFGCAKEYDVSIRLLSEQITDISLVYYYKIGFTIEEDLNYLDKLNLLLLPHQFKLQSNKSILGTQSDIKHLSKPIQSVWCILSNIWSILIQTCPGGLSRQIMAHVSSKILESAVQQLDVSKINSGLDFSMQFRDELWLILGIAKFALYRSAETISEVLGVGNLSVELNTIHTTGLLTSQMLLSCYTPRHLWEKLHEKGFYSQIAENTNKTFDFSLSNWLAIIDSNLFHDIPIHFIIWIRFKELKDQRLEEDESFHDYKLVDKLNENPTNVFINYTPKRRVYWDHLFPSGYMPCGCLLPEPFSFNNIKQSHLCTSPITDINRDNNNNNGDTNISTNSSTRHQLKITSKFELEEEIGNYANYYQKCGCSQEVWFELAYDIIRLPVINCSPGLQSALTKINDFFITLTKNQSVECSEQINNNNNSNSIDGQHFAIQLVILYLNYRIHEEIKTKSLNNEYKTQQQSEIEQLQYSILLEYLKSLLNVNDESEEINACKKRVRSFLAERNNDVNDSESFIQGNSSRIFKNIQNLRFVQHKALLDLFFMHKFLHANTTWISELIRSQRQYYKTSIHSKPNFQLDESFIPNVDIKLTDSIEEVNWEKIHCINVGLQEL